MILSYKKRRVRPGEIVKVHRNLADTDGTQVWSILTRRNGKELVVGHADALVLRDVEFKVREGGHDRALRTGQRNVHAYAIGRLAEDGTLVRCDTQVRYNPFRAASFTDDTGEAIDLATKVMFDPCGRVWAQ
jgi:hypothetical protein